VKLDLGRPRRRSSLTSPNKSVKLHMHSFLSFNSELSMSCASFALHKWKIDQFCCTGSEDQQTLPRQFNLAAVWIVWCIHQHHVSVSLAGRFFCLSSNSACHSITHSKTSRCVEHSNLAAFVAAVLCLPHETSLVQSLPSQVHKNPFCAKFQMHGLPAFQ